MGNHFAQLQAIKNGTATPKPEKKIKPIAPLSKKRQKLQVEYRKVVSEMIKENDKCGIKAPGCTGKAQGLHHIVKKSVGNMIEATNLLRACNFCNMAVESNDKWARKNGFVKSKFKK